MKLRHVVAIGAGLFGLLTTAGAGAAVRPQVIRFTAIEVSNHQTKTGIVFHDRDYIGSKQIGTDTGTCTFVSKNIAHCKVVFVRTSGTIFLSLNFTSTATAGHGVVTGGTGAYFGNRGTFTFRQLNKAGTRTRIVLSLK